MTACVNRKHTGKVAAVVTASLVGALSLGAAPLAAMADTGIEMQFTQPEGAFANASIVSVSWTRGLSDVDGDGVYEVTYAKNQPVALSQLKLSMYGTGATADLTVTAQDDDYTIDYYNRDSKGNPTGDPITDDITEVGNYVAVVTAVDGPYKGGEYYVRFDIDAIKINKIWASETDFTYNAESHQVDFYIDTNYDGSPDTKLYPGDDYDVEYVRTGHDATNVKEVKDAGTYTAKITGKGGYAGTVELSENIKVHKLDLSLNSSNPTGASNVRIIGLTSSSDTVEPKNLFAIVIDGKVYSGDDAIMSELQAQLTDNTKTWFKNGTYNYTVTAAKAGDPNIENSTTFDATKVSYDLTVSYGGKALQSNYESFINNGQKWDENKLSAHADDGTKNGVDKKASDLTVTYIDENGQFVSEAYVKANVGTYTVAIEYVDSAALGYKVGCVAFTTITTYADAVNADATAAVTFDADGSGPEWPAVVSSINTVYDGTNWKNYIDVVVKDSNGNTLVDGVDYQVKYYNAEGKEVGEIVNAGTYTLKVTSSTYKLSGTTEMAITVGKLDMSTVRAGALKDMPFDRTDNVTKYLPWNKDGYAISDVAWLEGLDLEYKDAEGNWQKVPMNAIKVTVTDAEGNKVEKLTDEGYYTIHFEARNSDAQNNLVVPGDINVAVIKDGSSIDGENDGWNVNHLRFADVTFQDYFANPVDWAAAKGFMNGYSDTKLFGSYDQLTRGQVACILYNMATYSKQVDESKLVYNELVGYETGFSDVNGKAYYGKAIAWAKQAGVVNGYGDGTFAPDAPVTREEFAAMIANYAKKYDRGYKAGDTDVLAKFDDASSVSDWAKEVVAWAVENGIMGNGGFLNASGDIIRADAACMVYNYAYGM